MFIEPFVPADVAARTLGIKRRFLLDLARDGIGGAYPLGTGKIRQTWVFILSELREEVKRRKTTLRSTSEQEKSGTIRSGVSR